MSKCKFHKTCEYYYPNPTCNNDKLANGYCGKYKENQFREDNKNDQIN